MDFKAEGDATSGESLTGTITHDDGYVDAKPLTIDVVGGTATVRFTWDRTADGGKNVAYEKDGWKVLNLSAVSIHLEHDDEYYNRLQDGVWYNKGGVRVGVFTWE